MRTFLAAGLALFVGTGCLVHPGPIERERVEKKRGRAYDTVVFSRDPSKKQGGRSRPLAELRETLAYWTAESFDGAPRWRGVLAPVPVSLYETLIERIDRRGDDDAAAIKLVSYQYDAVGIDALTVVDYFDEEGELIGSDSVPYAEPLELGELGSKHTTIGYGDMAWWEYAQLVLDTPVALIVGTKELAGEIVKSPLSAFESWVHGAFYERRLLVAPLSFKRGGLGFAEDWQNGFAAFAWRFRARARHTPLDTLRDLLGAVPLVGPVFDHKTPPPTGGLGERTSAIVVGQGIHSDGEVEQGMVAWGKVTREWRPDAEVWISPYRYGGVSDVAWALLNISNGMGYRLAEEIAFQRGVEAGTAVELVGFSGSAQRSVGAAKALRLAAITVNRFVAVAGPVGGFSCARENHHLIGDDPIADPVVLSISMAKVLHPFPTNVRTHSVAGAGKHHTPFHPHPATRAPALGYAETLRAIITAGRTNDERPNDE